MEAMQLRARTGEQAEARAEVTRFTESQRMAKALPIGVGGTVLGLATIVIPGLHFVSTWAVPLLSIGVAYHLYNRRGSVGRVEADCPLCGGAVQAEGGSWEEPMWVRCSACNAPLEVRLEQPIG